VADRMPQDLAAERQAMLDQLFEGLTEQRRQVFQEIESGQLSRTLQTLKETIDASDRLAKSVDTTLTTANALAQRVAPEGDASPKPEGEGEGLAEYQTAVEETTRAAEQLTVLAKHLDSLLKQPAPANGNSALTAAAGDIERAGSAVVDRAFTRLLIIVIAAPLAIALAMGGYKWAGARMGWGTASGSGPAVPGRHGR
jgi:hypothetical protein